MVEATNSSEEVDKFKWGVQFYARIVSAECCKYILCGKKNRILDVCKVPMTWTPHQDRQQRKGKQARWSTQIGGRFTRYQPATFRMRKAQLEPAAHAVAPRRSCTTPGIRIHSPQDDVRNARASVRRSSLPHSGQGALGTTHPRKSYPQSQQTKVGRFTMQMRSQASPLIARTAATIPNNATSTFIS